MRLVANSKSSKITNELKRLFFKKRNRISYLWTVLFQNFSRNMSVWCRASTRPRQDGKPTESDTI